LTFIDVTRPLGAKTRLYPGDLAPWVEILADTSQGAPARFSMLHIPSHAGTHVDAPSHIPGGKKGVESLPLESLIGPALVVQAAGSTVRASEMAQLPSSCQRVLLRGEAALWPEAARALADRGVVLVGTDGLSVDPIGSDDMPAHRILLEAGIVLLENLDLSVAPPGSYDLIALPLLVPGADGAPARVVLRPR